MKDRKRRVETFSFYDHTGIEMHLEEMAEKGWMLSKINRLTWEYKRIEQKNIKFAVTYYPKASEFDSEPSEGQMIYREYGEKTGWKFICSSAQMQIFFNESESPVSMETDPTLEIEVIHKAAKRSFLPTHFILLLVSILQAVIFITSLIGDLVGVLSSGARLSTGVCWVLVFVLCIVELAGYYWWRHRASKVALYGEFLDTKSHEKFLKIALVMAIFAACYIAANLFSSGNKMMFTIYLLIMVCLIGLALIVNSTKQLLKRKKASRKVNMAVTFTVDIVLAFAMVFGIGIGVLSATRKGLFEGASDTQILYQIDIPLAIEDLQDIENVDYIRENRQDESIFLGQRYVWQSANTRKEDNFDIPGLNYELTIVKVPAIYDFCKNSIVGKAKDRKDVEGNLLINHYEKIDATPWAAREAYQLHWSEGILNKYILCYESRIVKIDFDWEPTDEQKAIVAEKLGGE